VRSSSSGTFLAEKNHNIDARRLSALAGQRNCLHSLFKFQIFDILYLLMKLTAQVKLQPATDQSHALLRTLEMVNLACNALSKSAWERKEFRRFPLQKLCYSTLRADFPLTAQIVVRLISKVSDAYKLDQKVQREFRPHGSISYDLRVLSWNMSKETVSIWSLDGRLSISFVCGGHHRELLNFQRGETDLVYRGKEWFLFTTVDVPDQKEREAIEWMGVDMGLSR
jgi:putative transposase